MKKSHQEKERQRQEARRKNSIRRWKRRALWIIPILAVVTWIVYAFMTAPVTTPFPFGDVHWHATIDLSICGETRSLSHLGGPNSHYGGPVLHTHGDNQLHLEGNPGSLEGASLGAFFEAINIPFSDEGIFEYVDGSPCADKNESAMQVFVNDKLVHNASSYIPRDTDVVRVVYQ